MGGGLMDPSMQPQCGLSILLKWTIVASLYLSTSVQNPPISVINQKCCLNSEPLKLHIIVIGTRANSNYTVDGDVENLVTLTIALTSLPQTVTVRDFLYPHYCSIIWLVAGRQQFHYNYANCGSRLVWKCSGCKLQWFHNTHAKGDFTMAAILK